MDMIDRKIVRELMLDGRMSNVDLAERVGLSASACSRRVQELERAGTIRGYRAVLDPIATGGGLTAYVTVGLSRHTMDEQRAFEHAIAGAPAVRECHNVTGAIEYILRVEVSDLASYKHFHTEVLGALPQVSTITSYMVLESPKDERA
ncbi:MAG: Lrp/AsnC family transcriptional regulator [Sphingomonadales bacterium]|nr:Lrp/AsnC family transcriptional regulator [Sphingomonadales bacterium]